MSANGYTFLFFQSSASTLTVLTPCTSRIMARILLCQFRLLPKMQTPCQSRPVPLPAHRELNDLRSKVLIKESSDRLAQLSYPEKHLVLLHLSRPHLLPSHQALREQILHQSSPTEMASYMPNHPGIFKSGEGVFSSPFEASMRKRSWRMMTSWHSELFRN